MRKDSFYDRFPATPEGEAEVIETVETDIRRQIRNNFDAAERLQDICIENKEELVETLVKRQMWYYTDTVRERFVRRGAECK
jgi:hypothetical protein